MYKLTCRETSTVPDATSADGAKTLRDLVNKHMCRLRVVDSVGGTETIKNHKNTKEERHCKAIHLMKIAYHIGLMCTMFIIVDAFVIVYRLTYGNPFSDTLTVVMDVVFDCIYILRVVINCSTPYLEHGLLVNKREHIIRRYTNSNIFIFDALVGLPTSSIAWLFLGGSRFHTMCRINKLVAAPIYWSRLCSSHGVGGFRKMTIPTLLILHTFTCMWEVLTVESSTGTPSLTLTHESHGIAHRYIRGMEWSIKHMSGYGSTGHFPETDALTMFMLATAAVGALLYATFLALFTATIIDNARRDPKSRLIKKLDEVADALLQAQVPKYFRDEVRQYYVYMYKMAGTVGMSDILDDLPDSLLRRVHQEIGKATLARLPMFTDVHQPGLIERLSDTLVPRVLLPNLTLIQEGDPGEECIFIVSGYIRETRNSNKLRLLGPGDRYGDKALLMPGLVTESSLTCTTLCTVFVLHSNDFKECLYVFIFRK